MDKGEPTDPDEGPILGPDELDITEEENVLEIDDSRYVISTDDDTPPVPPEQPKTPTSKIDDSSPSRRRKTPSKTQERSRDQGSIELSSLNQTDVHQWMNQYFQESDTRYGFDITGKFDEHVSQNHLFSNNVVTAFENLVLWYAQQVGGDTPVEEALGILLSEANVKVRFPHQALVSLLKSHDLESSDTIGELLRAVNEDGGVVLSPRDRR